MAPGNGLIVFGRRDGAPTRRDERELSVPRRGVPEATLVYIDTMTAKSRSTRAGQPR